MEPFILYAEPTLAEIKPLSQSSAVIVPLQLHRCLLSAPLEMPIHAPCRRLRKATADAREYFSSMSNLQIFSVSILSKSCV